MREYSPADHADYAEEYSKLYYYAEKDRLEIVLFWGLGFVCVNQRDLRETLGFSLCKLLEYSYVVILPQITQITQRNTAWLYYYAEKDRLELGWIGVWKFVCVNLRDTFWEAFCKLLE